MEYVGEEFERRKNGDPAAVSPSDQEAGPSKLAEEASKPGSEGAALRKLWEVSP